MEFHDWLIDSKINALNVSVRYTMREYWDLAAPILERNELQRRRVRTSGKTYDLLRRDLLEGCVMPPVILAIGEECSKGLRELVSNIVARGSIDSGELSQLQTAVEDAVVKQDLIILDGLQRTYTVGECFVSAKEAGTVAEFESKPLRSEIYIGLSKLGILYRMLTLNTGQTPMSFRHQIEILYHDYLDNDALPNDISIVREVDEGRARGLGKYKYADIVDMFYAFATGVPKSVGKQALISQLRELDFIEEYDGANAEPDRMLTLLTTYHAFAKRVSELAVNWQWTDEDSEELGITHPFGKNALSVFARVQAMTGFGAECHRLVHGGHYDSLEAIRGTINEVAFSDQQNEAMYQLCRILNDIASSATKIGDSQRNFFQFGFRHLLNPDSAGFKDLSNCWLLGQQTYASLF